MALEVQPEEKNVSFEENSDKAKSETTNTNVQEKEKNENGKRKLRKTRPGASKPRVKCNIPELKDKIFDCSGYKQAEEYKKSKEALESYLSFHCKYGSDVRLSLENMSVFVVPEPITKKDNADDTDAKKLMNKRINEKRVDEYVLRECTLESNLREAYSIAWDMCTEELQAKLIGLRF